jgi:hypothetical protein
MNANETHDLDPAESLRSPEKIGLPDPRMGSGAYALDRLVGHHQAMFNLPLGAAVPEAVRVHFETAKNLFLYSWCVYRFYMVAEQYALTTLELALRSKLIAVGLVKAEGERIPGFRHMLRVAQDKGLVSDARFTPREEAANKLAHDRHSMEMIKKMEELGLSEMTYDSSAIKPTEEDLAINWLERIADSLPDTRNMHAHGTSTLYPTVLMTFVVVHNIMQQLFEFDAPSLSELQSP